MTQVQKIARQIRLLVLDVDGVLTDGRLYFDNQGNEMKAFNTQDGHGIKLLQKAGVKVGIITGRKSQLVEKRARDLGIELLIQGREDKFVALNEMRSAFPCELEQIAFMGDDHPDLTCMVRVGLAMTTANAHPDVVARAHWQSGRQGGEGAVREACDFLLHAQDKHAALLAHYTEF
ncbi:KdsC family phosphatase [Simiduia agarivorans]|uniref:3-deoxy-D-manno-octulosonate 8-phosphate phosphatase KdsC n=1 Tax=Simiduia agarivorans (strain DSM 21679 / JCM 13881 / BCRC 17597 / SA1) TaxID=1117647 RepID=K4KRA3_SIMAS|nr:HAD-IIIA family hydrolase [Simiduia agarivorans]AFV00644.1 3-deoxy-D-manno-octulosonate 8-phosphate phosphatase [Simiduia agarivorans SA1 = DSM 21679]